MVSRRDGYPPIFLGVGSATLGVEKKSPVPGPSAPSPRINGAANKRSTVSNKRGGTN
jgi:hypothetical protein